MAEDRTPYLARIVFPFLKNKIVCLTCIHTNVTCMVGKERHNNQGVDPWSEIGKQQKLASKAAMSWFELSAKIFFHAQPLNKEMIL